MVFKKGHIPWTKGKTKEDYPQLSNSGPRMGRVPWNKGKKLSEEHRKNLSKSHMGNKSPIKGTKGLMKANKTSFKKGLTPWNKGKKAPQIAKAKLGVKRLNMTGENHFNFGKKFSKEYRRKLSESHIGINVGKNNPNWTGGMKINYKITRLEWMALRQLILERDLFKCRDCGKTHHEAILHIHHIIPFKISQDNSLNNLITYCRSCHRKAEALCMKEYRGKYLEMKNIKTGGETLWQ